jgi:poly(A) polymerase
LLSGKYIDLSIARKELRYELSRVPICAPASSVEEDMVRRDLTINALSSPVTIEQLLSDKLDLNTSYDTILDYYQGRDHIQKGILKTPRKDFIYRTFTDDPLRVLRVCRLKSQLDSRTGIKWRIDESILEAWGFHTDQIISRLYIVSTERVMEELNKMLKCQSLNDTLNTLKYISPKLLQAFLRDELSLKAVVKQKDK